MIIEMVAAAALTAPGAPTHGSRQSATVILSDHPELRALEERFGWADAVVSGDMVYVSGVVAGKRPGETAMEPGFVRAFEQLGAILNRAGASFDDVIEVRSYHTDPVAQFKVFAEVKLRYIKAPSPAWTAVGTSGLLDPNGLVEISLVARIQPHSGKRGRP